MWSFLKHMRASSGIVGSIITITVIVLLVGALFIPPILARTSGSPVLQCQDNLRELGTAVRLYAGDWDCAFPSSALYGGSDTWDPNDFSSFAACLGSLPPSPEDSSNTTWPMALYPYLRHKDAIWCPSDSNRSEDPAATVSYFWKAAVDAAWYGGPDGTGPICRNENDFDFPDRQIILYEGSGRHLSRNGLVDRVTINCCFLDGHVSALEIRDSGYTQRENPPGPLPISGVGEPAWFNYSYGSPNSAFDKGQNWNPHIWGDNMREVVIHTGKQQGPKDPASSCISNLRRIGLALQLYMGDYDYVLPNSAINGNSPSWNEADFTSFAKERGTLPPPYGDSSASWPMLLYPYFAPAGAASDVMWCPSDKNKSDDPSASVSYYWKAAVDRAAFGNVKEGEFAFSNDQMVLYEHTGWHSGGRSKGLVDGVKINCLFLSGRAAMIEIRDSGYIQQEDPPEPLPLSGIGEPAWFNYSYGSPSPTFDKGQNWDPAVWGDRFKE